MIWNGLVYLQINVKIPSSYQTLHMCAPQVEMEVTFRKTGLFEDTATPHNRSKA